MNIHPKPSFKHKLLLSGGVILVFLGLFMLSSSVFATVKLTAALRSWDDGAGEWENGNLTMWLNSDPQPFSEVLGFDNKSVSGACGTKTKTKWAGTVQFALDHTDTNGAKGFQSTQNWYAVDCTTFSKLNTSPKYPAAAEKLITCVADNGDNNIDDCEIISQDVVTQCSTGNCTDQIVTTVQVNLDKNCNGDIDDPVIADLVNNNNLCFYWEAEKPPVPGPGDPQWTGNLQARIAGDSGGDKTINFKLRGPNIIKLQTIAVEETPVGLPLIALLLLVSGAVALGAGSFLLIKRRSQR